MARTKASLSYATTKADVLAAIRRRRIVRRACEMVAREVRQYHEQHDREVAQWLVENHKRQTCYRPIVQLDAHPTSAL